VFALCLDKFDKIQLWRIYYRLTKNYKLPISVCHAELNAIMNSKGRDVKNCKMYVTLFPCNECAKIIIQSRIRKVIYASDKYAGQPTTDAAKQMFQAAGIKSK
jgi:dCMP deaminase